jgi:hypothetical protein
VDALSRATEGAIVAHGAEHLASELAALGRTEMGSGRDEYATAEALGAASSEMAAAAVRSAAAGAADLAAAKARGGLARAVVHDGAKPGAGAPRSGLGRAPRGQATARSQNSGTLKPPPGKRPRPTK